MTWQNPSVASRPKCCKNIGEEDRDSHRPLQTLGYIMHSIELILVLYPGLRPACQEAHPCPLNVLTLLLCLDFKGFIDLKEQRWQDIFSKAIVGLLHFELNKFLSAAEHRRTSLCSVLLALTGGLVAVMPQYWSNKATFWYFHSASDSR